MQTEQTTYTKAEVIEVTRQETSDIPGLNVPATTQTLHARILEGANKGDEVKFDNDYVILSSGDTFYLRHTSDPANNLSIYSVADPYRLPVLGFFTGLFILCVIVFGGKQGMRGLAALVLSLFFIGAFLLPGIMNGYSAVLVSVTVAALIIVLGSYITHGFNRVTSTAVIGMVITVIVSGLLAMLAMSWGHITGLSSEDTLYLTMETGGKINLAGLLLGGMIIGLLGVLYDAAIGQSVSVDELHQAAPQASRAEIFKRAMRIGREHVGALVNTLAIAYVGVSLPLLLLFYSSGASVALTINKELFATEIIRMMVGSIGLVLAVPITTLIASYMLIRRDRDVT